jgi:Uricase
MGEKILGKNPGVASVSYKLPNKHYIRMCHSFLFGLLVLGFPWLPENGEATLNNAHCAAVDLTFVGLGNTRPEDAEVFCPIAAPGWVDCPLPLALLGEALTD